MSPSDQDREFLQYGYEAVERPIDSVLDDSVAVEPVNDKTKKRKKRKKKPPGKLVLIVANGYKGYNSIQEEIQALEGGFWLPQNKDFRQTAADTRNKTVFGASNADEFFGALEGVNGKISRVVFIGHGFSDGLALSGTPLDYFAQKLEQSHLVGFQSLINTSIKPKFTKNAKLDLVACNVAIGKSFLTSTANALGICVRAFSEQVYWCTTYNMNLNTITSRGRIGPKSAVAGRECSAKVWTTGVNHFVPPVEVCPN